MAGLLFIWSSDDFTLRIYRSANDAIATLLYGSERGKQVDCCSAKHRPRSRSPSWASSPGVRSPLNAAPPAIGKCVFWHYFGIYPNVEYTCSCARDRSQHHVPDAAAFAVCFLTHRHGVARTRRGFSRAPHWPDKIIHLS